MEYDKQIQALIFQRDSEALTRTFAAQLAITLHGARCRYNHTDGCSWFYEIKDNFHDWNGSSHSNWLEMSKKAISESETLQEINP